MNNLKSKIDYGQWGQQFTPPYCYELAGKTLKLKFELYEASAEFVSDTELIWNGERLPYWCLKATNRVYLICFGLPSNRCVTLIADIETKLVTLDETAFDEVEKPYKSAVDFGTIAVDGESAPTELHAFTTELADNRFLWIFCETYWHVESYTETECTHICNYPEFNGAGQPYQAVKITDTLYWVINQDAHESICMLYNLANMTSVGRSVVYQSAKTPVAQGAIGAFSDTIEPPAIPTVVQLTAA
ncbi:MAG: hypothetical protein LBN43_02765 [Oscillospiraceae bacterium]|jgi:hypothetical protein|nr:hypothetical protein [Oscillospiraceae bacterium]